LYAPRVSEKRVVLKPLPFSLGRLVHHHHEQRAHIAPGGDCEPVQRRGRAPHALWCLVVQEIHAANVHERVGDAVDDVLQHHSEHAHRHGGARAVQETVPAAVRFLSPSTTADTTTLLNMLMVRPMPVRWSWRCVMPVGCTMRRRSDGTSTRS
jgi:hypothetical protein